MVRLPTTSTAAPDDAAKRCGLVSPCRPRKERELLAVERAGVDAKAIRAAARRTRQLRSSLASPRRRCRRCRAPAIDAGSPGGAGGRTLAEHPEPVTLTSETPVPGACSGAVDGRAGAAGVVADHPAGLALQIHRARLRTNFTGTPNATPETLLPRTPAPLVLVPMTPFRLCSGRAPLRSLAGAVDAVSSPGRVAAQRRHRWWCAGCSPRTPSNCCCHRERQPLLEPCTPVAAPPSA